MIIIIIIICYYYYYYYYYFYYYNNNINITHQSKNNLSKRNINLIITTKQQCN